MESIENSTAPEEKHQVKIGPRTLLFDLNKDLHNFDVYFEVESENSEEEFHVRVLTQKQLDQSSSKDILQDEDSFKKTKGYINGNVKSQENVSENHFLALKAPKDMTLFIKTRILPISAPVVISKPSTVSSPVMPSGISNGMSNGMSNAVDYPNLASEMTQHEQENSVHCNPGMRSTFFGLTMGRLLFFFRSISYRQWFFYGLILFILIGGIYYVLVYRKNKGLNNDHKSKSKSKEKEEIANDNEKENDSDQGDEEDDGKSDISSVSSARSSSSKGSFQEKLQDYLKKKSVKSS
jgi:hypothetical protein